jgi:L-lysine 2,3-aminomutase
MPGVMFEGDGLPGHIYRGFPGTFRGYADNVLVTQNYLAVTGACMMTCGRCTRRSVA